MLRSFYNDGADKLRERLGYLNPMQVPAVKAVFLNIGCGDAASDSKLAKLVQDDLTLIAAQKSVLTVAKQSIAGFKIRKGATVGCRVTVRGRRMYELLERILYVALPRERDFVGFKKTQFDGRGNFSFSIKEHISFLEIDYDKVDKIRGVNVTIKTSARNDSDAKALLIMLGFPFVD